MSARLQQVTSPPQAQAEVIVNDNFDTLEHQAVYGLNPDTTSALTWGYYGGRWGGFAVADGTLSLTNSSTNYIVAAVASGVTSVSTSSTNWNNAIDYKRAYKLTTSGGVVTATEDHRAGPGGVHGSGGGTGGSLTADTDGTLAANSDTNVATQKATKTYVDSKWAFGTVAVSGQSNVVADVVNDTLTLAAGSNITITTNAGTDTVTIASASGGDASTNTATSVDSEIALFSSTTGKIIKRATGTGLVKVASGVMSIASAGTDYQAADSDLTTIAGLTATTDSFMQAKSSAWAARTVAQVAVDLQGDGLTVDLAGFRGIPSNSQSAAYTTVAADAGKSVDHPSTDANARTFTIDSNANVAYPVGTCISFSNMTSQAVTIAITSDTMRLAGTGTTGSRTLAQYGTATARKVASTVWLISGVGLT